MVNIQNIWTRCLPFSFDGAIFQDDDAIDVFEELQLMSDEDSSFPSEVFGDALLEHVFPDVRVNGA